MCPSNRTRVPSQPLGFGHTISALAERISELGSLAVEVRRKLLRFVIGVLRPRDLRISSIKGLRSAAFRGRDHGAASAVRSLLTVHHAGCSCCGGRVSTPLLPPETSATVPPMSLVEMSGPSADAGAAAARPPFPGIQVRLVTVPAACIDVLLRPWRCGLCTCTNF